FGLRRSHRRCSRAPHSASYLSLVTPHHHHPALHSFPTRRSSDLINSPSDSSIKFHLNPRSLLCSISIVSAGPKIKFGFCLSKFLDRKSNTSELQSRENLVCRLLLEKKKTSFSASRPNPYHSPPPT